MYVHEVVLDGFKSYPTRTVIGPFDKHFNAITGLNGSGKSNVLDAICFVLGISNLSHVRAANLQELVYKHGQAGVTKASVTVMFDNRDKSSSPPGYEEYDQITVARQVVVGGKNKYLINGHTAQLSRVQNLFHSVQLNVNNPHFLIMQGQITKVLNMKPAETLSMVEEAAGTRLFESKKVAALKTMEKKDRKLEDIARVLEFEIVPTLSKLRKEREGYVEWSNVNLECEKLQRWLTAFEFFQLKNSDSTKNEQNEANCREKMRLEDRCSSLENEMSGISDEVKTLKENKEREMDGMYRGLEERVMEMSKEVVRLNSVLDHSKENLKNEESTMSQLTKSLEELVASFEMKNSDITEMKEKLVSHTKKHENLVETLENAQESHRSISAGVAASGETTTSLTEQIQATRSQLLTHETEVRRETMKSQHLTKDLKAKEKQLKVAGGEDSTTQNELNTATSALEDIQQQLSKVTYSEEEHTGLSSKRRTLEAEVQSLQEKVDKSTARLSGALQENLASEFPGVKGVVASLVKLRDPKTAVALEVTAGGKLFNLISDNEETGKKVLQSSSLKRRVTILPLSKIHGKVVPPDVLQRAKGLVGEANAHLALSLIGYDEELDNAMKFVFGETIVCRDIDAARTVAFDRDVRKRAVTLQGDVFDPAGTLTGGSRPSQGSVLMKLQELHEQRKELNAKKQELVAIGHQLNEMNEMNSVWKKLQKEKQVNEHHIAMMKSKLSQSKGFRIREQVTELKNQLEETQKKIQTSSELKTTAENKLKELEEEATDFSKKKDKKLKTLSETIKRTKVEIEGSKSELNELKGGHRELELEISELKNEISSHERQLEDVSQRVKEAKQESADAEVAYGSSRSQYDEENGELEAKKEGLAAADSTISKYQKMLENLRAEKTDAQLEIKRLEHKIAQYEKDTSSVQKALSKIIMENSWIETESESQYDFKKHPPDEVREQLNGLLEQQAAAERNVNKKVLSMLEHAENEYKRLTEKRDIVAGDKRKIEDVITDLDVKKQEALHNTWRKVNRDFGVMITTLLPGITAKLEKLEDRPLEDGLEIRVAFGSVWKESLSELSGGQRSLMALALVLALLRCKPAPMYILDEVDAALDLSHTQNIGRILRTHFSTSQFIIVSLKEGMFNNANVIFRVQNVNGQSRISRTEGR